MAIQASGKNKHPIAQLSLTLKPENHYHAFAGISLGMHPANEPLAGRIPRLIPTLLLLVALQFLKTASGATTDVKVGIMMILSFQC